MKLVGSRSIISAWEPTSPPRRKEGLQNLHAALNEGKIQHVFYESPGTNHEWQTWRRGLKDFGPHMFQPAGQQSRVDHGK